MSAVFNLTRQFLQVFLLPIGLLIAAWLLAPEAASVPTAFAGLWSTGPYIVLSIVGLLGLAYGRGRVILAALLFALGNALVEQAGRLGMFGDAAFLSLTLTVLIPINLLLIAWYEERGVFTIFGVFRTGFVLLQVGTLAGWLYISPESFQSGYSAFSVSLVEVGTDALAYPQFSYAVLALSFIGLLVFSWLERSHFTYGLIAGFVAYCLGLLAVGQENLLHANTVATGLILCIAILRDSYNMAYRDELTGLPQRRALNELFMSLSGDYAVAMMDVDHFKKFNDTHGHDIGDDVLRMVASQIAKVRDGGRAFRYGGEEFTVVYPAKVKEQALRSLERVREAIEDYEMVIRPPRKHKEDKDASASRGKGKAPDAKSVSVTISIGVADRDDRTETHDHVLKKADEALYHAKRKGRNRVVMWSGRVAG